MPLFAKLTMRPPASALERIMAQHPFRLFLASLYPVKGQLEIMLNVLLHSLSFIYSFLTDLKIVNANIKKKKKKERKKSSSSLQETSKGRLWVSFLSLPRSSDCNSPGLLYPCVIFN